MYMVNDLYGEFGDVKKMLSVLLPNKTSLLFYDQLLYYKASCLGPPHSVYIRPGFKPTFNVKIMNVPVIYILFKL